MTDTTQPNDQSATPGASDRRVGRTHSLTDPLAADLVVPYVTSWSEEKKVRAKVVERPGIGIAFAEETVYDRDREGVLWASKTLRHGKGRPEFGVVHGLRQRHAMRRLLCQVCAQPADRNEDGALWLLPGYYQEAEGWPENYDLAEPPICLPCVPIATQRCPALRKGYLGIRARNAPICGVRGLVYQPGPPGPALVGEYLVRYDHPTIHWTLADQLLRTLHNCTPVNLDQHDPHRSGS
jgi:hypothetical protein